MKPVKIEAKDEIRTAAAATSFAIFALPAISGLTMSTIASSEVLISSSISTNETIIIKANHSREERPSISPRVAAKVLQKLNLKFLPLVMAVKRPSTAYTKLYKADVYFAAFLQINTIWYY